MGTAATLEFWKSPHSAGLCISAASSVAGYSQSDVSEEWVPGSLSEPLWVGSCAACLAKYFVFEKLFFLGCNDIVRHKP